MAIKQTPLVAQYLKVKEKVPDAILFFRLGDFYEMFFEDAEVGARVLDIQLTSRSKDGVPLCGVPYHSAQPYIARLLKAGHKVAICEQTAADGNTHGLMSRQVVRVITPGTSNEELVLASGEKSFLVSLNPNPAGFALAAIDVSTGEFIVTTVRDATSLNEELRRLAPREILIPGNLEEPLTWIARGDWVVSRYEADAAALGALSGRFGAVVLSDPEQANAAGAALLYVERNFGADLGHLTPPRPYCVSEFLLVDETSRRHLELIASSDGAKRGSLLGLLDETATPMGARTLAQWIIYPLIDPAEINQRLDTVEEFFESDLGGAVPESLKLIGDLERLAGRVGCLRASPRDCLRMGQALKAAAKIKSALDSMRSGAIKQIAARVTPQQEAVAKIEAAISDEPPVDPHDGNVIRAGFDSRVDESRSMASDARGFIARLEAQERERTKISSLKVRYNNVFGYYIEVTKTNLERVPATYERKQTLVSAERFTTPELKELERKIMSAESGLKELELQLFTKLVCALAAHIATIQETARALGELDALLSLARVARRRGYVRPIPNSGTRIEIRDGRHPVLEAGLRPGEFVANDLIVDPDEHQLLLLTGPNMAGKSTYLRQVALIVIMAQMGGFVPASEAQIGIVDRIFTRIGARDELRRGESTFMVEMRETARLLEGLTPRSLLLLDEVGRGTSTFDGLAIAWALAEYLHDSGRAKVLFATHFHELVDLARERPRVKNFSMAVREWAGEVIFLRRVIEGAAERSYGIQVARLAGLPDSIVTRAREILANLEQGELDEAGMPRLARDRRRRQTAATQMSLFSTERDRLLDEIKSIDIDHLTPVDALNALARLAALIRK
jgi:DNA mismatch repair protein MutS